MKTVFRLRPFVPRFAFFSLALAFLSAGTATHAAEATNSFSTFTVDASKVEGAQARLKEIEDAKDLEETLKTRLLEGYRQAISRWEGARVFSEKAATFHAAVTNAPVETRRLRERLAAGEDSPELAEVSVAPEGAGSERLGALLAQARALLASARGRLQGLEKQLADEQDRPAALGSEMTQARALLDQIQAELAAPAPTADAPEIQRVARLLLEARRDLREAEIQALEQERLSAVVRQERLAAGRDEVNREIARLEEAVSRLEAASSERRQQESRAASAEAQRLQREALGKHQLIKSAAEAVAKLTSEIAPLLPDIDAARARRVAREKQLAQIRQEHAEAKKSIDLGVGESIGAVLFEQRRQLPLPRDIRSALDERNRKTAELRLRLFQLDRELQGMADVPGLARSQVRAFLPPVDEGTADDLAAELETALGARRDNLEQLVRVIRESLSEFGSEETVERELLEEVAAYAELLDGNLLWIRNAARLGSATFARLSSDTALLLDGERWSAAVSLLRLDMIGNPSLYLLDLGFVILLTALRRRWLARFDELAQPIGKVGRDNFGLSLRCFALHIGRSLPLATLGAFVGWRLIVIGEAAGFSKAVGHGLAAAAALGFVGQIVRGVYRGNGLGPAHFKWSETAGRIVRDNLGWFLGAAVPLAFVTGFAQRFPDPLVRHSVGRLAFLGLMATTAFLGWRLFHPARGLTGGWGALPPGSWRRRCRPALLLVAIGLPLLLAVLAGMGYFYTSLQFLHRLILTIGLGLLVVFVNAFLTRWLLISERRLALKVALEKRAARQEGHDDEDDELKAETLLDELEEIDIDALTDQSRDLLRISLGLGLILGLLFVWAGVLPALQGLGAFPLWDRVVNVDGQEKLVPVTLGQLGMALLFLGATVAAARNLPGFLEIALLQRLAMEPGTRYATRALTLYAIVGAGILAAFKAIGVGWASVQWLAAALTVGLGFGLQEIFANFVSGLIILLERPIRVGDTVTVGSVSGVVSRIRMRATTITDWSRKELVVPNKNFITGELINWSLSDPILRLDFPVGIAYGSNTVLAHKTMLQVCREHPMVLEQPEPTVFFTGFGDNSLNFDVRVFVSETSNTGRTRILHDLHMAIDQACRDNRIEIAFPQRDLHLKSAPAVIRVEQIGREPDQPAKGD